MIKDLDVAETDVLSSWKEIASHLRRGVRTAQRWEAQLQMPVYRPWGKDHSAVIALKSEIDVWIKSRSREKKNRELAVAHAINGGELRFSELAAISHALRADVARSSEMLNVSIAKLIGTLQGLARTTGAVHGPASSGETRVA